MQKTVTPGTATANATTTFTYTISVTNMGSTTTDIDVIYDQLPGGFTYVPGSTSGSFDPTTGIYCLFGETSLTIASNTNVTCNIASNGDINIGEGATIVGNVFSLGGGVELGKDSTVTGNIRAATEVKLIVGSHITGDVRSGSGNLNRGISGIAG